MAEFRVGDEVVIKDILNVSDPDRFLNNLAIITEVYDPPLQGFFRYCVNVFDSSKRFIISLYMREEDVTKCDLDEGDLCIVLGGIEDDIQYGLTGYVESTWEEGDKPQYSILVMNKDGQEVERIFMAEHLRIAANKPTFKKGDKVKILRVRNHDDKDTAKYVGKIGVIDDDKDDHSGIWYVKVDDDDAIVAHYDDLVKVPVPKFDVGDKVVTLVPCPGIERIPAHIEGVIAIVELKPNDRIIRYWVDLDTPEGDRYLYEEEMLRPRVEVVTVDYSIERAYATYGLEQRYKQEFGIETAKSATDPAYQVGDKVSIINCPVNSSLNGKMGTVERVLPPTPTSLGWTYDVTLYDCNKLQDGKPIKHSWIFKIDEIKPYTAEGLIMFNIGDKVELVNDFERPDGRTLLKGFQGKVVAIPCSCHATVTFPGIAERVMIDNSFLKKQKPELEVIDLYDEPDPALEAWKS